MDLGKEIKLYNTASKKLEVFKPIKKNRVGMYNCGPTVYDYAHIGNLRAYVFADILRRVFEYNGYGVKQIINITDIGHLTDDADSGEDKMTKGLRREGKEINLKNMQGLGEFYSQAFILDLKKLNIEMPKKMPRASKHVRDDIKIIESLEKKGFTYKTSDGIYFDTSRDSNYGKLGGTGEENKSESRIADNNEKKNPNDFALWKFNEKIGYKSPWGQGFPGWHIECSGMSKKYLGETFDIHTGGMEHIPIHHNNEIAQSENANDKPYVNYWLHNAWLQMNGEKASKSLGNVLYLSDLEKEGIDPISYRYLLLQAHYASPINFSWDALNGAKTALRRLKIAFQELGNKNGKVDENYRNKFVERINDNLDTPQAIAVIWELIKDENVLDKDKRKTLLDFDRVLGLDIQTPIKEKELPPEIQRLIKEREIARKNKDWEKADRLRDQIKESGFNVEDR